MKVFSVSELTGAIKSLLEPNFRAISVQGEISNFKLQSSGHLYFSMKDADAQISCALFRGNAAALPKMPKDGDQVVAKGELSIYAPRGSYQIIIRELSFLGVGELLLKLHQLKETLAARGWFEATRKKPLPKLPRRIGIVTSPTGAVIQDILHVLKRRFANMEVILNPVKVQGEGAAAEIAQAIQDMNRYQLADVLIVGRGGGSIEDLWAFNEEIVAKAIFESKIPIISAVGHETDFTIADFVADVRAPTPSAAAEIATAEKAHLVKMVENASKEAHRWVVQRVEERNMRLDTMTEALDQLRPSKQIPLMREKAASFRSQIDRELLRHIAAKKDLLARLRSAILSVHPNNLLKKGYAILFSEKGDSLILSGKNLTPHQPFVAVLADARIRATALQIEELPHGPF